MFNISDFELFKRKKPEPKIKKSNTYKLTFNPFKRIDRLNKSIDIYRDTVIRLEKYCDDMDKLIHKQDQEIKDLICKGESK